VCPFFQVCTDLFKKFVLKFIGGTQNLISNNSTTDARIYKVRAILAPLILISWIGQCVQSSKTYVRLVPVIFEGYETITLWPGENFCLAFSLTTLTAGPLELGK
jgi:hypothetical protein